MNNIKGKCDTSLNSPHHQRIKIQEDDHLHIYGYEKSPLRTFFTWVGYIFSLGLLRVVFHWIPHWHLHALDRPCSLRNATKILIEETYEEKYKQYMVVKVENFRKNNSELTELDVLPPKGNNETIEIYVEDGELIEISHLRLIHVKKVTFIWHENVFKRLRGLDCGPSKEDLASITGYDSSSHILRERIFGPNLIECPVQSFGHLLLLECLNPLYFFQLFTLSVWIAEKYYYYCFAIIIMSVYGIASSIIQTRRNQKSLQSTVTSTEVYSVWRNSEGWKDESSDTLIPGDVVRIPKSGANLTFDGVLLNGNCIVNESMLTGESVPVTKTPILKLSSMYNVKEDSNHTLFSGTKVIQTRSFDGEEVRCVVIRTGFDTAKGELVRYILFPKTVKSQMDRDPYRGMIGLGIIAAIGCLYTIIDKVSRGVEGSAVAIFTLDIITIVIPAALPAAITMGKMYAQSRLSKNGIYCINSHSINVAGSIDCICFDKTGTLTEDGLDMWGCIPIIGSPSTWSIPYQNIIEMQEKITDDIRRLTTIMASCHSLTYIDNEFLGDPLDVKMFESTGWILEEPNIDDNSKFDLLVSSIIKDPKNPSIEIGTVRQNQFNSTLQRMSVVVRTFGLNHFEVLCKGSPEKIISLCRPESVPENTKDILKKYTSKGYRVIAAAIRELPPEINYVKMQRMTREELETDLVLCGLIILENRLKSATQPVIQELIEAKMKVYMLTGDNIETALSVARQCGMLGPNEPVAQVEINFDDNNKSTNPMLKFRKASLSEMMPEMKVFGRNDLETGPNLPFDTALAMTGTSWKLLNLHFPLLVSAILERTVVMGRLSSDQKQQVVIQLQALDYHVAMCGDGANDCGALKSAHIGVSLSDQESSVASPFTSKIADISSVIKVIREGRAALITSFGVFRFMVCYSLTEFFSVAILYSIDSNLTDLEFLFVDIILVVNFLFFFGKTQAYQGSLYPKTPISSLISLPTLMSIATQSFLTFTLQIFVFYIITLNPWFIPYVRVKGSYKCHQNYAVWAISLFQYISQVVAFSRGSPYRKPIYTNGYFIISLIITSCLCVYLVTYPSSWVLGALDYVLPPSYNFIILILSLGLIHFIISIIMERFLEYWLEKRDACLKEEKQNMVRKSQSDLLSNPYNSSFGFVNYNFESDSKV